jgi:hypothetical protein
VGLDLDAAAERVKLVELLEIFVTDWCVQHRQ